MTALVWRSLHARRAAFVATGLSVLLGTAVLTAFLSLLETGLADGVSSADGETLTTIASVVGGWSTVIVLFSVASMLALTVRRRAEEFALLRTIGTTRRQVRGLVLREALTIGSVAAAAGLLPGWLLGGVVFGLLQSAGLVADGVDRRVGGLTLGCALAAVLLACSFAGVLAARAATRGSAQEGLTASRTHRERLGPVRIALGTVLLAVGAGTATLTVTVMADSDDPYDAMSTAGPTSISWSIGLALFAPPLLRAVAKLTAPLVRRAAPGVPGHLAVEHVRRRAQYFSGVLVPVLVFVGPATGTLYLMQIENSTSTGDDLAGDTVGLINYLVVGMIAAFAAIMVVNGTVAAVADRRREFTQQRLAGVTRAELVTTAAAEAGILLVAALVFGGLASLGTVIPYSVVKTDGWLPTSPWLFLGIAAVAVVIALGTAVAATRRAVAAPVLRPSLG
jgi:predicted lysophospholipase L1 biosynthesis ABC-type transport system permease subunit